jgi:hypothetical protein
MSPRIVTLLVIGILATACARAPQSPTTGSITGTLSGAGGPIQNAEVKLQSYADENCAKLSQKDKLSEAEDAQYKQCSRQMSSTISDAQGKYSFPNVADGWYSLNVNWTTNEDPLKSNPMWKPIFLYREEGFLVTFIAAKDSSFRGLAVGEPFRFSGGDTGKRDLKLKL